MQDKQYQELKDMFGKDYADAARKAVHSGDIRDFMRIRRSKGLLCQVKDI
jgi:hypothetical protein